MRINDLRSLWLLVGSMLGLLCGCGDAVPSEAPPVLGAPIVATAGTWTWVDFPDSTCDDGTPTGIGINPGTSDNVLIFLNGGGACWDYSTCFVLNTAAHGPFGRDQFTLAQGRIAGSILDRNLAGNPFRDWSLVSVPYCTGDVHAGDNVVQYGDGNGTIRPYQHRGRANMTAFLTRLGATFKNPRKLVFSGSSAGGYGAGFNYALARRYWTTGAMYLLDDSGPPLIGPAIPPFLVEQWEESWRFAPAVTPLCGAGCTDDLSQLLVGLGGRFPQDRAALLSSTRDRVIRTFLLRNADQFEIDVNALATQVLDPLPRLRYFYVGGERHTMLGTPTTFTSPDGVALLDWLTQMVTDDPAWVSHRP